MSLKNITYTLDLILVTFSNLFWGIWLLKNKVMRDAHVYNLDSAQRSQANLNKILVVV